MKKLTAGIFATILGLTTVNAFAADQNGVASTQYVRGAMNAAVTSANTYTDTEISKIQSGVESDLAGYVKTDDFDTFKTANTSAIGAAKVEAVGTAASDATTKANAAKEAAISAAAADATSKANTAETNAKAYTDTKVGNLPQGTADVVTYVDAMTSGIATEKDLTALQATVAGHTTSITNLTNDKLDTSTYNTDKATFETITGAAEKYEPVLDAAERAAITSGITAAKVADIATALADSAQAKTDAATAVGDAAQAKTDAAQAKSDAAQAQSDATSAIEAAATAGNIAQAASGQADAAVLTANTAKEAAETATTNVTNLTTTVNGHTASINTLTSDKLDKSVYNTDKPTFALKTEVQAVDAKLANYVLLKDVVDEYKPAGSAE